jgi:hypothetical protein
VPILEKQQGDTTMIYVEIDPLEVMASHDTSGYKHIKRHIFKE